MPTHVQLQSQITDLEGALHDEREERLESLAELDVELEAHDDKFAAIVEEIAGVLRRLSTLEMRVAKLWQRKR